MNYYAQGGQPYGINTLDNDYYSRGVQYKDGVPAFGIGGSLKKAWKGTVGKLEDVAKPITKPITDAVKPILPYVQYVAPFIPGVGPLAAAGLGALGSGFAGGGGFNFKRGLMGGMTAYGLSNLYAGMQAAGGAGTTGASGASAATAPPPVELGVPGTEAVAGEVAQTGLRTPGAFDQVMAGDFGGAASTVGDSVSQGISSAYNTVTDPNTYSGFTDKVGTQMSDAGQGLKNLTGLGDTTMTAKDAATAFGNKAGIGSAMAVYGGVTGQAALDEFDEMKLQADLAAAESEQERAAIMARIEDGRRRAEEAVRNNPYQFAEGGEVPRYFGGALIRQLVGNVKSEDAQRADLASLGVKQEILNNADSGKIRDYYESLYGSKSLAGGPLSRVISRITNKNNPNELAKVPSTNVPAPSDDQRLGLVAMINSPYQFAYGGPVDDEAGLDDWNEYQAGGIAGMAKGGMAPRFLSGGGDGMSDDIPATINGKQPARLADGEFVIPADVVSHLGNGSSKAGAKQLYSMMDKVRTARTGTKKQGKEINPAKYMPA